MRAHDLTAEQALLLDSTASFVDDVCPIETLRGYAGGATALPADYLRRGAELGWFAMLVAEEYGGGSVSGDGLADAALLAEARGASVQPGPFVPMNVVAFALARSGSEQHRKELLPAIVAGEHVAAWALSDPEAVWSGRSGVTAIATTEGYVLNGCKPFVQDPGIADSFLVDAIVEGCPRQVLVSAQASGVGVHPLESLDFAMKMGRLELDDVLITEDDFVGSAESTEVDRDAQLDVAVVLANAETVGAMDRLFEMTLRYAGDRIAFGRPIGSFQAIKHQLADLSLLLEMCKASSEAAVQAVAEERGSMVASVAKAFIGDASAQIAQGCFQVFGGIGFTWEHDLHLYLRRASVNEVLYGTPTWHRERIVRLGLR